MLSWPWNFNWFITSAEADDLKRSHLAQSHVCYLAGRWVDTSLIGFILLHFLKLWILLDHDHWNLSLKHFMHILFRKTWQYPKTQIWHLLNPKLCYINMHCFDVISASWYLLLMLIELENTSTWQNFTETWCHSNMLVRKPPKFGSCIETKLTIYIYIFRHVSISVFHKNNKNFMKKN